jgi:hypothetical protein
VNNTILHSTTYGIFVPGAFLNIFYGNRILDSGTANALDDGNRNNWDNSINLGNYWDNYNGTGVYRVPGSADSIDRWPKRIRPPFLWIENEIEAIEGVKGQNITWNAYDENPLSYEIFKKTAPLWKLVIGTGQTLCTCLTT